MATRVAAPSAEPAAAMAVVAQTIPEDADADCSGLIEELSIKLWGVVVGVSRHIRNPTSRFVNSLQVVLNG